MQKNNITEFPFLKGKEVEAQRTGEFYRIAWRMSKFMDELALPKELHDHLVELMIDQVLEAEHGAFSQGFLMGLETAWDADEP